MNVTNFKEKPYFDSLPRYTLPALQAAFDKAESESFSSLAIYNGLCRDFAEVGVDKPKQHVFNEWIDGIRKKTVSRPGGAPVADDEMQADMPAAGDAVSPLPADDPARNDEALMMQRRVTQSGQLRINGKYFKADGVAPGTDVFVRPDPRDANRYAMFGLTDGRYVGEAVTEDPAEALEAKLSEKPWLPDGKGAVERDHGRDQPMADPDLRVVVPNPYVPQVKSSDERRTYLGNPITDPDLLAELKRRQADFSLNYVGVDLANGPDQSVKTVVTVKDGKPFFTPAFPAEEADTLVERMIAEAKADLSRDLEGRAKRLVAERLRLLAASIEGDVR